MFDQDLVDAINKITSGFVGTQEEVWRVWLTQVVFTWHWWLDVALAVLPWVLWRLLRRKEHAHRLLCAGFSTMLMATYLDIIGMSHGLWTYYTWVVPLMPEYLPWDLSVMPVMSMLFYQYMPRVNPWIKAGIFAALGAFVSEPIFDWIGIYGRFAWEYWYSFPIYIVVYMIGYRVYQKSGNREPVSNTG